MASFVALYRRPADPDAFLEYYKTEHMPLLDAVVGITSRSLTRFTGTPRGGEPDFFLQFEVTFDSDEDLQTALRSDAFRAVGRHAAEMVQRFGGDPVMLMGTDA